MILPVCAVSAADLPAEIVYDNISNMMGGVGYVTQDGEVCFKKLTAIDRTYEYNIEDGGTYFYDVKSLCEGYNRSVYIPGGYLSNGKLLIKNDGTLWCYDLDNGVPRCNKIEGIENCIKAGTGGRYAIALLSDGTVYTWGYSYYGIMVELDYNSPQYVRYPKKVEGLENIIDIAVGDVCAYALDSDGNVYTWGENIYNPDKKMDASPVRIPGIENCVEIDKSYPYLLARTNEGKVYQLVDQDDPWTFPIFPDKYYKPVLIEGVDNCVQMSAEPFVEQGLMLSADKKLLHYSGSIWKVAYADDDAEMHKVVAEDLGDIVQVVSTISSHGNYYIMDDYSVWKLALDSDNEIVSIQCLDDGDIEDRIKIESIRFVKRSEMAEQLMELYEKLTDKECVNTGEKTYNDVDKESQYKDAIEKCYLLGLMDGTDEEGNFSPNKVLRREQAAVILERLCNLSGIELEDKTEKYDDDEKISDWAKESVYKTAELFERSDNVYNPQEYVTYDELEGIIERITSKAG